MPVLAPTRLHDAVTALAADPAAHVLAGGTDVMVEVSFGHRRPPSVVAVDRVEELLALDVEGGGAGVRLGAGVTYTRMLEPPLCDLLPALAEAARTVGSPQIRNAGTLGGNLGTCSPAGDALPVLSALDATIELASATGPRTMSVHEFMVGVKRTALGPGEVIVAARVPVLHGWQGYAKVGTRNAMVISVVGACLAVDRAGRAVRLALGAVGPTIVRAREAEAWIGERLDWDAPALASPSGVAALAVEFGARAAAEARPIDDHRSTAAYRRHAAGVLARRLLVRGLSA
jgi:CO/xanthine dehydrogenase FAD-binding subunit